MDIKFNINYLDLVIEIFKELYPKFDKSIEIHFVRLKDHNGALGETLFPDDDKNKVIISLDITCPYEGLIEILGHELAHAVTPSDSNHGKAWEDAFDKINKSYIGRIESYFEKESK